MKPNLHYWLATLYLEKIGSRKIITGLEKFKSIDKLFLASQEELQATGFSQQQIQAIKNPDWKSVDQDLAWAEKSNQHILTMDDSDYPVLLKEIHIPPMALFVRGNKTVLQQMQIAIVGSRHATAAGLQTAEQFAYYLAQSGLAITSGLALGIDGASHKGTLKAKGMTVGVAGTGLNQIYPPANRKLSEQIVEQNGAVISEFPLSMGPYPANFPRRNRIISGLSVGVLVVEAALQSGSLITARHALEQGREVFAIPGSIHQPLARGCHHLIRQGAKLVETAKDILEELGGFEAGREVFFSQEPIATLQPLPDVFQDFRQILEQVGHEITPIDMIILQSGLTSGEVSSILLKLELHGYIESVTGGYRRVAADN